MRTVEQAGGSAFVSRGVHRTIVGLVGDIAHFESLDAPGVPRRQRSVRISTPYKLVSRDNHPQTSTILVDGVPIGPGQVTLIAGPCAVETPEQTLAAAQMAKRAGASLLRGGAYKPRTSPYAFQGLGEAGLKILTEVKAETGLPIVTEVVDPHDVDLVADHADLLQIGTRNMQNFGLLQAVGGAGKPVMLKRGLSATLEEWLMAAEYVAQRGNLDIVLCERGIRTFETATRNTLDVSAVPMVHTLSHLPIVVDPSHAGGHRHLVVPLARAAIAAGADGVIVDIHPAPGRGARRRCAGTDRRRPAGARRRRPRPAPAAGSPRRPVSPRNAVPVPDDRLAKAVRYLMQRGHAAAPDTLPEIIDESARLLGAESALLYVIDYEQVLLVPLVPVGWDTHEPVAVEGTLAGRAFTDSSTHVTTIEGTTTLWVPLLDGTERLGVLQTWFRRVDPGDAALREDAAAFASVLAEVLMARQAYGDNVEQARRRLPMSLAAEMQWAQLPPLTFATRDVAIAAILAPAYEVAGDSFDYSVTGDVAQVTIVDAMGHGLDATLMSSVAVGAIRNARRAGLDLVDMTRSADKHVAAGFGADKFVTAIVAELRHPHGRVAVGHRRAPARPARPAGPRRQDAGQRRLAPAGAAAHRPGGRRGAAAARRPAAAAHRRRRRGAQRRRRVLRPRPAGRLRGEGDGVRAPRAGGAAPAQPRDPGPPGRRAAGRRHDPAGGVAWRLGRAADAPLARRGPAPRGQGPRDDRRGPVDPGVVDVEVGHQPDPARPDDRHPDPVRAAGRGERRVGDHDQRADRRAEPLRQAHRQRVEHRAVRRQRHTGRDLRVPHPRAVAVQRARPLPAVTARSRCSVGSG